MKPKSNLLGKPVNLLWEDAYCDEEAYVRLGDPPEQKMLVELVGFVTSDLPCGITVAREKFLDGRYRSIQFIPRGMVRRVKILR